MKALALNEAERPSAPMPSRFPRYLDPLDEDEATDAEVVTSMRGITRIAVVAAEAGARFQREATGHDPVAWMLAPRRLFRGVAALEACLSREDCLRAILLHGLSIGLDADPATIDMLLADGPGDESDRSWGPEWDGVSRGVPGRRRLRLYSAVIVIPRGGELLHIFHASVAPSASVVRDRIRGRFGNAAAAQADIQMGVDLTCPSTASLLPPAFRTMIESGRRIRWSAMSALDVTVEHRIPC